MKPKLIKNIIVCKVEEFKNICSELNIVIKYGSSYDDFDRSLDRIFGDSNDLSEEEIENAIEILNNNGFIEDDNFIIQAGLYIEDINTIFYNDKDPEYEYHFSDGIENICDGFSFRIKLKFQNYNEYI